MIAKDSPDNDSSINHEQANHCPESSTAQDFEMPPTPSPQRKNVQINVTIKSADDAGNVNYLLLILVGIIVAIFSVGLIMTLVFKQIDKNVNQDQQPDATATATQSLDDSEQVSDSGQESQDGDLIPDNLKPMVEPATPERAGKLFMQALVERRTEECWKLVTERSRREISEQIHERITSRGGVDAERYTPEYLYTSILVVPGNSLAREYWEELKGRIPMAARQSYDYVVASNSRFPKRSRSTRERQVYISPRNCPGYKLLICQEKHKWRINLADDQKEK